MIEIDGSYGEGGGQIVRTACSLAALTGKPCRIFNIRRARTQPGLRLQHVLGLKALAELCGGSLQGGTVGSGDIGFHPGKISARDLTVKIGTAASVTLILQALLPAALALSRPLTVGCEGGATDTPFAPTFDYFRFVFLALLKRMGGDVTVTLDRRGYYPRGGALVSIVTEASRLSPITLTERGSLRRICLRSRAARVLENRRVAERQIEGALNVLGKLSPPTEATVEYGRSISAGTSLCAVAEFDHTIIGADALGARGKPAETVGEEAASSLSRELQSTACIDRHMADQLLVYMALAGDGGSITVSEITSHCRTNIWVIEKFMDGRFDVKGKLISWSGPRLDAVGRH